jgi:hypothetical protein
MAVGLYFQYCNLSPDVYDEAMRQLGEAGAGLGQAGAGSGSVPGLVFHCAMEAGGTIRVFDVWESMEQFQRFEETLLPILGKLGADHGEPQVATIHNMQHG